MISHKTARSRNLNPTGRYSRKLEEAKAWCAKLETLYPKARFYIVVVPDNPLSRGPVGKGYSIYASSEYLSYEKLDSATRRIASIPGQLQLLKEHYEAEVAALQRELADSVWAKRQAETFLTS